MVYSPITNAFKLTAQGAGGQPDFMQALRNGMLGAREAVETAYKPKTMAEALLNAQLVNKIKASEAKYSDRLHEANLANTSSMIGLRGAQKGMIPYEIQLKQAQMQDYLRKQRESEFGQNLVGNLQGAPGAGQGAPGGQGSLLDNLKNNPAAASYVKNKYGIDVNAQSPAEKLQQAAEYKEKFDQAAKLQKELEDLAVEQKSIDDIDRLIKEGHLKTGFFQNLKNSFGLGSAEQGELAAAAQPILAIETRKVSARGGSEAAKQVKQTKPDISNSLEKNKGITKQLRQSIKRDAVEKIKALEKLSGKSYGGSVPPSWREGNTQNESANPLKSKVFSNSSQGNTVVYYKGKIHHVPNDKVEAALKAGGSLHE